MSTRAKMIAYKLRHLKLEAAKLRRELRSLTPRKRVKARPAKASRDLDRARAVTAIRDEVFARAKGRCEAWPSGDVRCGNKPEVLDHWLGGIGRRRQKEEVSTCWALCLKCNDHRTANWPSAAYWNDSFARHCYGHDYDFIEHRTRGGIA